MLILPKAEPPALAVSFGKQNIERTKGRGKRRGAVFSLLFFV